MTTARRFMMHTKAMEAWNHVCPDLLHTPYYARSITSIMPGQTWRDTGHKALCPVSARPAHQVLANAPARQDHGGLSGNGGERVCPPTSCCLFIIKKCILRHDSDPKSDERQIENRSAEKRSIALPILLITGAPPKRCHTLHICDTCTCYRHVRQRPSAASQQ